MCPGLFRSRPWAPGWGVDWEGEGSSGTGLEATRVPGARAVPPASLSLTEDRSPPRRSLVKVPVYKDVKTE